MSIRHKYNPDEWRVCKDCGAQGDLLCTGILESERPLNEGAKTNPAIEEIRKALQVVHTREGTFNFLKNSVRWVDALLTAYDNQAATITTLEAELPRLAIEVLEKRRDAYISVSAVTVHEVEQCIAAIRAANLTKSSTQLAQSDTWCDDCHGYSHRSDCPSFKRKSKPSAEQIVEAVYRSMSQYEDGTWFLDNLKAKARVYKLLDLYQNAEMGWPASEGKQND